MCLVLVLQRMTHIKFYKFYFPHIRIISWRYSMWYSGTSTQNWTNRNFTCIAHTQCRECTSDNHSFIQRAPKNGLVYTLNQKQVEFEKFRMVLVFSVHHYLNGVSAIILRLMVFCSRSCVCAWYTKCRMRHQKSQPPNGSNGSPQRICKRSLLRHTAYGTHAYGINYKLLTVISSYTWLPCCMFAPHVRIVWITHPTFNSQCAFCKCAYHLALYGFHLVSIKRVHAELEFESHHAGVHIQINKPIYDVATHTFCWRDDFRWM